MQSTRQWQGQRYAGVRRGFTLIEILVVVAIIALLIAILLPSLNQVRWQAKQVACLANLHDLGRSFVMYSETYKGYLSITDRPGTHSFYSLWKGRLLKNPDILICPATSNKIRPETLLYPEVYTETSPEDNSVIIPDIRGGPNNEWSDISEAARFGRDDSNGGHSYENNAVYNGNAKTPSCHPLEGHHKRITQFKMSPHNLMLVHDNDDKFGNHPNPDLDCEQGRDSLFGGNNCPQTWDNHGAAGINMMFADGHSQFQKKLKITYENRTNCNAYTTVVAAANGSIDKVWMKSQYPWEYNK